MPQSYTAGIPYGVQRRLIGILAAVGRLFGYRTRYPRFSDRLATSKAS
jgi:hypothetical protein